MLLTLIALSFGGRNDNEFGTTVAKEGYEVQVYSGRAAIGERGHVRIVIYATDGYRLDNEYDIKVSMRSPPKDVQWGQSTMDREDGSLNEDGTVYTVEVPYRAGKMGDYGVSGKVKFKVCRAGQCKGGRARFKTSVYAR